LGVLALRGLTRRSRTAGTQFYLRDLSVLRGFSFRLSPLVRFVFDG
jgi:hypothetical protein